MDMGMNLGLENKMKGYGIKERVIKIKEKG